MLRHHRCCRGEAPRAGKGSRELHSSSQLCPEKELGPEVAEVVLVGHPAGFREEAPPGEVQRHGGLNVGLDRANRLPAAPVGDGGERDTKVLEGSSGATADGVPGKRLGEAGPLSACIEELHDRGRVNSAAGGEVVPEELEPQGNERRGIPPHTAALDFRGLQAELG